MELIYAYAENYRVFHKKKFSFSNKFYVEYDQDKNCLSIERNPNYIDIYPGNILGISAIVGKNASGKTSLLDMIGEKIEDRHVNSGIYMHHKRNPYLQEISLENIEGYDATPNDRQYTNQYFLIYYWGKSNDGKDLFVLESDCVERYIYMLSGIETAFPPKDNIEKWEDNYFWGKSWISCVFCTDKGENIYIANTQDFFSNYPPHNHISDCAIVSFKSGHDMTESKIREAANKEPKIMVPRRYAPMVNRWIFKDLYYIVNKMNKLSNAQQGEIQDGRNMPQLYYNDTYEVIIEFADVSLFDYDDVTQQSTDFNDYFFVVPFEAIQKMSHIDKIFLTILRQFARFIFQKYVLYSRANLENKTEVAHKIKELTPRSFSRSCLQDVYLQEIDVVLDSAFGGSGITSFIAKRFQYLMDFLLSARKSNISYRYEENTLVLTIKKESQINEQKEFFNEFVDYSIQKADEDDLLLWGQFLNRKIRYLSEGEQENLAMYASINDQLDEFSKKEKNYILLFDEIERSMHPEMCRQLISDLINFLQEYPNKQFQIVIASHSPFIIGDIRSENLICLSPLDQYDLPNELEIVSPFGQNIHTLLKSKFFLNNTFSQYAVEMVKLIVKCLEKESLVSMETEIYKKLNPDKKYFLKTLPVGEKQTLDYLRSVIASLGEPILRQSLNEKLDQWCKNHPSKVTREEEIRCLRARIAELEGEDTCD